MSSAFNMLQCVVLFDIYEENLTSHRYVVRKEDIILLAVSDNCRCSFLYHIKAQHVLIS